MKLTGVNIIGLIGGIIDPAQVRLIFVVRAARNMWRSLLMLWQSRYFFVKSNLSPLKLLMRCLISDLLSDLILAEISSCKLTTGIVRLPIVTSY